MTEPFRAMNSRPMRCFIAALLAISALSAHPALADIIGPATVTDGDSIKIDNKRIRIHGIDAPEAKQLCQREGVVIESGFSQDQTFTFTR